ncbi:hypothetical protein [Novipirellula caenicola]|uniref:Uncharacterized protein n=1 Tax=Novipirellula caenicola TaxID=1536901 RepID=A0ABP9VPR2_9BACT
MAGFQGMQSAKEKCDAERQFMGMLVHTFLAYFLQGRSSIPLTVLPLPDDAHFAVRWTSTSVVFLDLLRRFCDALSLDGRGRPSYSLL